MDTVSPPPGTAVCSYSVLILTLLDVAVRDVCDPHSTVSLLQYTKISIGYTRIEVRYTESSIIY